jgi:hypothetical protein
MPSYDESDMPDGLHPSARQAWHEFMGKYSTFLKQDGRRRVALTILVWGPSSAADTQAAKKRVELREKLCELGHCALFSEHIPILDPAASMKDHEYAQARNADLIFVLIEDAPGAIAEVHDFGSDLSVFPKLQVMAPRKYRGGYSAKGALRELSDATGGGAVRWYGARDLERCNVVGWAIKRAEALRTYVYRNLLNRPGET